MDILTVNQAIFAHGVRWTTFSSILDSVVVGSSPSGVCRGPGVLGKERLAMVRMLVYVRIYTDEEGQWELHSVYGLGVCMFVCV